MALKCNKKFRMFEQSLIEHSIEFLESGDRNKFIDTVEFYITVQKFIEKINELLGISTKIIRSEEIELKGDRTERLTNICLDRKADEYLSGPAAKTYLDENAFKEKNIKIFKMEKKCKLLCKQIKYSC